MFGFPNNKPTYIQKTTFVKEDSLPNGEGETAGDTCILNDGKIYIYNGVS
jgi:hypothetical protein